MRDAIYGYEDIERQKARGKKPTPMQVFRKDRALKMMGILMRIITSVD